MADTIVYTSVSKGGGIDGMDRSDKGGNVTAAFLDKEQAKKNPNGPWNTIVPIVVDLEELAIQTLDRLDPVARLAVKKYFGDKEPRMRTR